MIHVSANYHWAEIASGLFMLILPGTHFNIPLLQRLGPILYCVQVDELVVMLGA